MEVAEAVMKRSIEVCSSMFGKMFSEVEHPFERTTCNNMQQMINKCCVSLGEKFRLLDWGFKLFNTYHIQSDNGPFVIWVGKPR